MKKEDRLKILNKIGKLIVFLLFCTFTILYISSSTGHYEYQQQQKVTLTAAKIKQFEQDVAQGKKIKIENYVENDQMDYQNKTSKLGLELSEKVGKYISLGIKGVFKQLNKLVDE
ncbi:MAG: hypothetical protein RR847_03470 [Bacilli bacterium]